MRRIILALVLCVTFVFDGFAQSDDELFPVPFMAQYPRPETVQQKDCDMVTDPTSVCNTGGEAFSEFLERFCTDRAFSESRFYIPESESVTDDDGVEPWMVIMKDTFFENWEYWERDSQRFTPSYKKTKCEESLKTWYGVTAEHVLFWDIDSYDCDPDNPEEDAWDGGGQATWVFERKEGKWYVTFIYVIG